MTAAEFAAGRGYSPSTLHWWSSRLRRPGGGREENGPSASIRLARVVVRGEEAPGSGAAVVVELGGARVIVPAGADRTSVVMVLESLRAGVGT